MTQNIKYFLIALLSVAIVGAAAYFFISKNNETSKIASETDNEMNQTDPEDFNKDNLNDVDESSESTNSGIKVEGSVDQKEIDAELKSIETELSGSSESDFDSKNLSDL